MRNKRTSTIKMPEFLIVVILIVLKINAQQAREQLQNRLDSFFDPSLENVFLHLNKTVFFKGERIWFQAYVYNQVDQKPSTSTLSLNVALYNSEGVEVDFKLVQIENGIGNGDFLVPIESEDNAYVIRAWTDRMAMVEKSQYYSQIIQLVGQSSNSSLSMISNADSIPEISIYPEGGNVVTSTMASFGFHISYKDPKNQLASKIQLINDAGKLVIDNIMVNPSGFGLVKFKPKAKTTYLLKIVLHNEKEILKPLPKANEKGMVLRVESISPSSYYLSINTNQDTFEKEAGNVQFLMFQKNKRSIIQELILDSTTTIIQVPKKLLFPGINSAILFDSGLKPVSERLIFNDYKLNLTNNQIEIEHRLNQSKDSIIIEISPGRNTNNIIQMSASVLPSRSKAYIPAGNTFSTFWVDPYVSRPFRQSISGNKLSNKQQLTQLDVQLLLEGPGKYSWEQWDKGQGTIGTNFPANNEIGISGRVQDADLTKERQLWFYSSLTANSFFTELDDNKEFTLSLPAFKGDSIYIALLGKNGRLREPNIDIHFSQNERREMNWNPLVYPMTKVPVGLFDSEQLILPSEPETIILEEVILEGQKKLVSGSFLGIANHRITETDQQRYGSLEIYLRRLGFRVIIDNSRMVVASYRHPYPRIPVFLNGFLADGTELLGRPLNMVSSINYDSNNPTAIFLTSNFQSASNNKNNYKIIPVESGYTIPTIFKAQNYSGINQALYNQFAAIHWQPNIVLKKGVSFKWMFPRTEQPELNIYIEGFSSDGGLISYEKKIILR